MKSFVPTLRLFAFSFLLLVSSALSGSDFDVLHVAGTKFSFLSVGRKKRTEMRMTKVCESVR